MMHVTTSQGLAATTSPHGLTFMIEGMAKDCSPAQQIREFIGTFLRSLNNHLRPEAVAGLQH